MKKLEHLFGGLDMNWKRLLVFALLAGAYTGLINQVPALAGTSFRDIAVSYEVWVFFAVVIAVSCRKPLEATEKVFVFFLISQAVCFLVEVPALGWSQAYAYFRMWFVQILLTFPGGYAAYYCKKDNWPGALLCLAGAVFEAVFLTGYAAACRMAFPKHLLTVLFCLFMIFCFAFVLVKKKGFRILVLAGAAVTVCLLCVQQSRSESSISQQLPAGYDSCTLQVNDGSRVEIDAASGTFTYYYNPVRAQDNVLTFSGKDGSALVYQVVRDGSMVRLEEQKSR